jgi:hypothetical protein
MLKELDMRNVFKARIAPILGIIAFVAVIGLVMISCGKEEDSAPPAAAPEAIFFLSADYGAYPNYPISATIREFKPPEGGARIDLPRTAPYRSIDTATDVDILICWFQEDAADGLYAEFKKASTAAVDENGNTDLNAARIPVVAKPEVENDPGTAYETYLGTIDKTTFANSLIDTSTNSSPKGLLFKPSAAGRYVAGIAVAQKFNEWVDYDPATATAGIPKPSLPKFLFSNTVAIAGSPPSGVAADFVGKWEMGYTFTPNGEGFKAGGYEVLKISDNTFRIFLSQKDEGIQFQISGWEKLPAGDPLLTRAVPNVTGTVQGSGTTSKTFTEGYKLIVDDVLLNMGYTDYDEFYVYKDGNTGNVTLYRTNGKYNGGKLNSSPYTVVRSYSKRTVPSAIPITADGEDWTVTGGTAPAWTAPTP